MSERPERKKRILVVIPAFNEEEKIQTVVRGIQQEIPEAVVLVVNDGSRDQTEARGSGRRGQSPFPSFQYGLWGRSPDRI